MNSVTLTDQLGYKKDPWSKFHKDPKIQTWRQAQSGITGTKIHS